MSRTFSPARHTTEGLNMGLKAPGLLTFMLAVILTVCILVVKFFEAQIPFIQGNEFWALMIAHLILVFGCLFRGI